jgi:carbamoyl-phosphate synthase large subunit
MKKVMVIAGGDWQIELIKKAKAMGHYVICSNLYENSPAFPYADACEVANVLDKERNLEIARKYMPDAVISDQSDIAVPTVAYLNEKLGLRGIGTEKADIFTDKTLMRKICKTAGLPVPEFQICKEAEDAIEMLRKHGKIIIKPIDSQSSRGVYTITSEDELKKKVQDTLSYSNRRKEFLAEAYIGGDEFTIDGLVVNGTHYPLCISIKEMYKENPNVSMVQTYTYSHPKYDYELLRKTNKALVESIGLPFGLTHSEYKYYKGQFYLIEAGARGGGSNLSGKIVPYMSGVDNYEYLIKQALGEEVNSEALDNLQLPKEKCVVMRFFDFGEGIAKEVHGKEYLKNHPNMIDYQLEVKPGDKLENPKYGRLRPGHFIVGADTYEEAQQAAADVLKHVYVSFEE